MRTGAFLKGGAALVLVAAAVFGCASLPPLPSLAQRSVSRAFTDTGATRLGTAIAPLTQAHPSLTGIYPLAEGRDAFAARALLAQHAERSLDLQYYIWRKDLTGVLMLDALRAAAARGVRVRLLLNDNNTAGLDPMLAALDREPNIEVRLFNPFATRTWRGLGYLTDFARLNRRMHNKSFTVDNQVTIVGGRNIGDEYFGAADDVLFADLDVMAIGPAVQAVSQDFDRYWNSASAYPVAALVDAEAVRTTQPLAERVASLRREPAAQAYLQAVRTLPFVEELAQRRLPLEWGAVRVVSDDPAKVRGEGQDQTRVGVRLRALLGEPQRQLDLVSPYFVPGKATTAELAAIAARGVAVRVLTNSLEATDVAAVHAGYAKWRRALLQAGVTVYELRREGGEPRTQPAGPFGSSSSSLHAKTFAVDRQRIFVGSFNFDPRSLELNTEMGLVMESPALAAALDTRLTQSTPAHAYQVRLEPDGKLVWIEQAGQGVILHDSEPGTGFWKRAGVRILSWLPIDWLL